MQTYPVSNLPQTYHIEKLFSLAVTQKISSTKIVLQSLNEYVNTQHIPFITKLLEQHLPTVLLTQCYNDDNLPFAKEVTCTEIGHLFEHILLEYLCLLKIEKGHARAVFSGRTSWNWIRDPRGKFHIRLNCGTRDATLLPTALEKTISLMKIILATEQTPLFPNLKLATSRNGLKNGKRLRKQKSQK